MNKRPTFSGANTKWFHFHHEAHTVLKAMNNSSSVSIGFSEERQNAGAFICSSYFTSQLFFPMICELIHPESPSKIFLSLTLILENNHQQDRLWIFNNDNFKILWNICERRIRITEDGFGFVHWLDGKVSSTSKRSQCGGQTEPLAWRFTQLQ